MNDLNEVEQTKYAVKVHGNIVSMAYSTPQQAEEAIKVLIEAHQSIAEVVPVTSQGLEILLG